MKNQINKINEINKLNNSPWRLIELNRKSLGKRVYRFKNLGTNSQEIQLRVEDETLQRQVGLWINCTGNNVAMAIMASI